MFNNTARGLMFKNKVAPKNGEYKFLVTELYASALLDKDIEVNYTINKKATDDMWLEAANGFVFDVEDEVFTELKEKAVKLHCEIYVYPKFME